MANYWNYSTRVKGSEESIEKFLALTYAFGNKPPENRWLDFSEIFDAEKEYNADGTVSVTIDSGNSKGPWSELIEADDAYPGAVSLCEVSEELEFLIEMFIYGDEWSSHIIIDRGQEVLSEDRESYDPIFDAEEYPTFEEWREAYGMPEDTTLADILDSENRSLGEPLWDTNMSWEDFKEKADGECFHFGGFDVEWTI